LKEAIQFRKQREAEILRRQRKNKKWFSKSWFLSVAKD
jgi:hypothetical protein